MSERKIGRPPLPPEQRKSRAVRLSGETFAKAAALRDRFAAARGLPTLSLGDAVALALDVADQVTGVEIVAVMPIELDEDGRMAARALGMSDQEALAFRQRQWEASPARTARLAAAAMLAGAKGEGGA